MTPKEEKIILKYYPKLKSATAVQNHLPHLSVRSVQRRIKALKEAGAL